MTETLNHELPFAEIPVEKNITLRQLRLEEADHIFAVVDNNREYLNKWLPWVNGTNSARDSAEFIEDTINKRMQGTEYGYAVCIDGVPVGHMSLMHVKDEQEPEIGYWVSSSVAGQGITTKAAQALTNFGFNTLGLQKIVIRANQDNIASNKVAEKLGYTLSETYYSEQLKETINVWAKSPHVCE